MAYPGYGPPGPPPGQYGHYPYPQQPGYGYGPPPPPGYGPPPPGYGPPPQGYGPPQQYGPQYGPYQQNPYGPQQQNRGGCMGTLMIIAGLLCSCCPAILQMMGGGVPEGGAPDGGPSDSGGGGFIGAADDVPDGGP